MTKEGAETILANMSWNQPGQPGTPGVPLNVREVGLRKMREAFPDHQISKLPKGTKAQNDCPAAEKRNCKVCGGWHHPNIVHLDYVGHAAITDRLLDADPMWSWEPMAVTDEGLPRFDASGGLWIKLTVCGVTRLGYGHAQAKGHMDAGAREKEVIGDALRNACMRFGAALELWHKGELHLEEPEPVKSMDRALDLKETKAGSSSLGDEHEYQTPEDEAMALLAKFDGATTLEQVDAINEEFKKAWPRIKGVKGLQDSMVALRTNARKRIKGAV